MNKAASRWMNYVTSCPQNKRSPALSKRRYFCVQNLFLKPETITQGFEWAFREKLDSTSLKLVSQCRYMTNVNNTKICTTCNIFMFRVHQISITEICAISFHRKLKHKSCYLKYTPKNSN